jgi:hydroxymethylbilane synthase
LKPLRIGTRASALAQWQAEHVRAALAAAGVAAELVLVRTTGDRERDASLRAIGGKGVFVKELEEAVAAGRVDLAVHSMKDVPTEVPSGLAISAICRRHDVRDALVSPSGAGLDGLPAAARVGTSSLRRQAQLKHHRPDLQMLEIRGNVDTRLAKAERGDFDAVVLAKAGLDRLGLADRITEVLPVEICLPAPGQGAIGVETRAGDLAVLAAVASLDDGETRAAVEAERAALAGLGGGCMLPVGAWARIENGALVMDACVLSIDGREVVRVSSAGAADEARALGEEVAAALLAQGAGRLLQLAGRSLGAE